MIGYRGDWCGSELAGEPGVEFAEQTEQLGTGHAVMMCRDQLAQHDGPVLILAGDSPMVQVSSLRALLAEFAARRPACLLGTGHQAEPDRLGPHRPRRRPANSWPLSRKKTPRPSSGRSPKST